MTTTTTTTTQPNLIQLQHLYEAAHVLATTSPALSAHLMSRFLALSPPASITAAHRRTICPACGTLRVPGYSGTVQTTEPTLNSPSKPKLRRRRCIAYSCVACNTVTREEVPAPASRGKRKMSVVVAAAAAPTPKLLPAAKKRRTAGGALSRLLAQKKVVTAGEKGFSLDLLDLLKTA